MWSMHLQFIDDPGLRGHELWDETWKDGPASAVLICPQTGQVLNPEKNWHQVLNPEIVEPSSIRGRFWKVFRDLNLSGLMEAFDSCQCNSHWNNMKVSCMPTKLMNLIKVLCPGSLWTVKVNGNLHKWVNQNCLSNTDSFIQNPFVRHRLYYKIKRTKKKKKRLKLYEAGMADQKSTVPEY